MLRSYIDKKFNPLEMKMKTSNKFDIRHKETLTLFLPEYFELFFPDLAKRIDFKSAKFLDKELIALFDNLDKPDKEISDKDRTESQTL